AKTSHSSWHGNAHSPICQFAFSVFIASLRFKCSRPRLASENYHRTKQPCPVVNREGASNGLRIKAHRGVGCMGWSFFPKLSANMGGVKLSISGEIGWLIARPRWISSEEKVGYVVRTLRIK